MSDTVLYTVDLDKVIRTWKVYTDARGSAGLIWGKLSDKYFGDPTWFATHPVEVWALVHRTELPLHHRLVLSMTMGRAIVEHNCLGTMAEHLRRFARDFECQGTHLTTLADDFESLANEKNLMGVCFHITTAKKNPWFTHDEDTDAMVPYNFKRKGPAPHFFVFAEQNDTLPEFSSYNSAPLCPWCGSKWPGNTLLINENDELACGSCRRPFVIKLRYLPPLVATKRKVNEKAKIKTTQEPEQAGPAADGQEFKEAQS